MECSATTSAEELGDLLARCGQDDHAAFRTVYELVGSRVHGVVRSIVRDPARSEEVTQEAFTQIWAKAAQCDVTDGSPMGWVISIARRRAIDCVRSEVARRRRDELWTSSIEERLDDDPGDVVVSNASREEVLSALKALPGDQAMLISLAFYEGLSHVELSKATGVPLGTVKSRVRAGMRALARMLTASDV